MRISSTLRSKPRKIFKSRDITAIGKPSKLNQLKNPSNSILATQLQLVLLIAVIVFAYWHGIFAGAPRSDQIGYLHQVGRFQLLSDILTSAPSFNRTESAGDFVLYRPLLYIQLGLTYFFFGFDFTKWQLLSLALHACYRSALFLLFPLKIRQHSPIPFLICIVFATGHSFRTGIMEPYNRYLVPSSDLALLPLNLFVTKRYAQSHTISFRFNGAVHL